jgi:hypothetical protein
MELDNFLVVGYSVLPHYESTAYKLASVKRLSACPSPSGSVFTLNTEANESEPLLKCRTGAHYKLALEASEKAHPVTRNVCPKGSNQAHPSWRQLQPNRAPRFGGPNKGRWMEGTSRCCAGQSRAKYTQNLIKRHPQQIDALPLKVPP